MNEKKIGLFNTDLTWSKTKQKEMLPICNYLDSTGGLNEEWHFMIRRCLISVVKRG